MSRFSRSLVGFAMFILGCATGGAASRYVETASAAPPPGATPWSYRCFQDDSPESIQERANGLGIKGWELASSALSGGANMSSPIWCFKRPR
jgi:hypothetical protein